MIMRFRMAILRIFGKNNKKNGTNVIFFVKK